MATKIPLVISAGQVQQLQAGDSIDIAGDAYSLVDGTRPFTGVVGGKLPTESSHLATKEYVDSAVNFVHELYLTNTADAIGGIYYKMVEAPTGEAAGTFTIASLGAGTHALTNFISIAGTPGATILKSGIYESHIHAQVTVGNKPTKIKFELHKRASGGAETLLMTSESSEYVTAAATVNIHATLADDEILLVTDRLVIKYYAVVEATGSDVTVVLSVEGTTVAHFAFPTTTEILSTVFLRQDGTKELTGNLAVTATKTVDGRDVSVDGTALDDIAGGYSRGNALINGGFDFFQRTAPGTLTAVADDAYGPDRWNLLTQTASVQIQRVAGDVYSVNAGRMKQNQASAQRMGLLQIVEAVDSKRFRGKTAIFQARVKCSASQAIRIAILEWTGTADSVTSDVVKDWTSATYTVDNFFLATGLTITAVAAVTPDADTWTAISVSGTVSASCNNIIAFIWTEATAAQNVTLDVTESGLYFGSVVRSWNPRPVAHELALCQKYFYSSSVVCPVNGADTTTLGAGCEIGGGTGFCFESSAHCTGGGGVLTVPITMRAAATPTAYGTSLGYWFYQAGTTTSYQAISLIHNGRLLYIAGSVGLADLRSIYLCGGFTLGCEL
jgi:hypothetical protein